MTRAELIQAIGPQKIIERLGVSESSLKEARRPSGRFPAKWYPRIRDLCVEAGVEVRDEWFAFMGERSDEPTGDGEAA